MTDIVEPTPKTTSPEPFRPWNLGKLIGQKPPLKLREVWAIRIRLQIQERLRDLAMFNLAIDSKLPGLRSRGLAGGRRAAERPRPPADD